eukprot:Selendium_serpulae@DN2394_c0_g1_i10.p1
MDGRRRGAKTVSEVKKVDSLVRPFHFFSSFLSFVPPSFSFSPSQPFTSATPSTGECWCSISKLFVMRLLNSNGHVKLLLILDSSTTIMPSFWSSFFGFSVSLSLLSFGIVTARS